MGLVYPGTGMTGIIIVNKRSEMNTLRANILTLKSRHREKLKRSSPQIIFAAMPVPDYLLKESATGYALYQVNESEEIGSRTREFLETLTNNSTFSRLVKLVSFAPFKNAAHALENTNDVSE